MVAWVEDRQDQERGYTKGHKETWTVRIYPLF